ncbi:MAG: hypothetical protein HZA89_05730, partial [Verrucomicrobia bacterium]|nr:hypothetical protein [Verrucomicrobiota bacterium]
MIPDPQRLTAALASARQTLLAERNSSGHWCGELSSSALSTATAVTALAMVQRETAAAQFEIRNLKSQIENGLAWLANHANADGGSGDTTRSLSNISTTALCWAAFGAVPGADEKYRTVVQRAEAWLAMHSSPQTGARASRPLEGFPIAGEPPALPSSLDTESLITAIIARYGRDRTFSVPILTMCALAGRLGAGCGAWQRVLPLPFELAACPHQLFAALRLPVVSYALPALIAIGQARHHHLPSGNPVARFLRNQTRARTLKVLESIQPSSGGFLEATPLTSFVTMSLAGSGQVNHPVVKKSVEFLLASARADGSWPIDTNLATWVTTLAVNALTHGSAGVSPAVSGVAPETSATFFFNEDERTRLRDWLLGQQYRTEHPYTHAAPGGWAWTDLPGGVPDADDTAGALIALKNLASNCPHPALSPRPTRGEGGRRPGEGSSSSPQLSP